MPNPINFETISTAGLDSSPVAPALAGLRAHEARYYKTKYSHIFATDPAATTPATIAWVEKILKQERNLTILSPPLETAEFQVESLRMAFVFYTSGLAINVMYHLTDPKKRAVGFKLSETMEIPPELAPHFKFAKQKSKLAGTIRGSFFLIKKEY